MELVAESLGRPDIYRRQTIHLVKTLVEQLDFHSVLALADLVPAHLNPSAWDIFALDGAEQPEAITGPGTLGRKVVV